MFNYIMETSSNTLSRLAGISLISLTGIILASCLAHRHETCALQVAHLILQSIVLYLAVGIIAGRDRLRKTEAIPIITLCGICLFQVALGMLQLTGKRISAHGIGQCTGTFQNPGPYGGFLAVSSVILISWIINERSNQSQRLRHLRIPVYVATASSIIMLPATMSRAGMLALAAGIAAMVTFSYRIRKTIRKRYAKRTHFLSIAIIMSVLVVAAGLFAYHQKKDSADGRLFMGKISIQAMSYRPLAGFGPGRYTTAYGEAQSRYFSKGKYTERERMLADSPEYAFNTFLAVGVEYGIPAMLISLFAIATTIIAGIRKASPAGYGLFALSVFALFSYPHEIKAFQIMAPLLLSICNSNINWNNSNIRKHLFALAIVCFAITTNKLIPIKKAESEWHKAEVLYKHDRYDMTVRRYAELLPYLSSNHKFLFQYGRALLKTGEYRLSDSILHIGAAISCDPMFWNLIGQNQQALKNYSKAEESFLHAHTMLPNRLYPLYLLLILYKESGQVMRFQETLPYVNAFKPKIESHLTEEMRKEILNQKSNPAER